MFKKHIVTAFSIYFDLYMNKLYNQTNLEYNVQGFLSKNIFFYIENISIILI